MKEPSAESANPKAKQAMDKTKAAAEKQIEKEKDGRKKKIEKVIQKKHKSAKGEKKTEETISKVQTKATTKLDSVKQEIRQIELAVDEMSPMGHGTCINIIPLDENGELSEYEFTVDPVDAYAPKHKTGIHNLYLMKRGGEGIENFDEKT